MKNIVPEEMHSWPSEFASRYRNEGLWLDKDLGSILKESGTCFAKQTALVDRRRSINYKDLYDETIALALYLYQLGLRPTDRVVVQIENRIEFVTGFFAFLAIGVRPIVALPAHREQELKHFINKSQARYLIVPEPSADYASFAVARKIQERCPSIDCVFTFNSTGRILPQHVTDLHNVDRTKNPQRQLEQLNITLDQLAFFQLSGGSTGLSKLIPRSHNGYLYSIRRSVEICHVSTATRYLAALPVAHNFPLSSPGILGVLMAGGTCVLTEYSDPERCFQIIEKHQITMTALVPPLAILWLEYAKKNDLTPSSLNLLQVGGAKLSTEVAQLVQPVLGAQLQQVFGMAEGLVCYTRLDDPSEIILNTQGRPMCDYDEVKVVDDYDHDVPAGQPGHLLTRGPYTIRGYLNEDDHNHRHFTEDGYYRTGDIIRRDDQGNFQVVGRSKDQINRGGEKIGAEEIENLLLAHEAVLDAAVVPIPDKLLGEKSCACILLRQGAKKPKTIELNKMVLSRGVAAFKVPDRYLVVDDLPKTKFGKVNKKSLREIAFRQLSLNKN